MGEQVVGCLGVSRRLPVMLSCAIIACFLSHLSLLWGTCEAEELRGMQRLGGWQGRVVGAGRECGERERLVPDWWCSWYCVSVCLCVCVSLYVCLCVYVCVCVSLAVLARARARDVRSIQHQTV